MEDQITLTLLKPITLAGVTYDHIDLREPNAGELEKAVSQNGVTSNILLISAISKLPPAVIRLMSRRDLEAAVEYLSGFTPPPGALSDAETLSQN